MQYLRIVIKSHVYSLFFLATCASWSSGQNPWDAVWGLFIELALDTLSLYWKMVSKMSTGRDLFMWHFWLFSAELCHTEIIPITKERHMNLDGFFLYSLFFFAERKSLKIYILSKWNFR